MVNYYWLPSTMLAIPVCLGTMLYLSIAFEHIQGHPPYISNTGILEPEKGWFSQLCNIYSFMMGIGFYLRYLQAKQINKRHSFFVWFDKLNICGLIFGFFMCLGLSITACYQVINLPNVHFFGATMFFIMGFFYFCVQVVVSYYLIGCTITIKAFLARLTLTVCLTISGFFLMVFKILADVFAAEYKITYPYILCRDIEHFHCASAIFEWVTTILFTILALAYADEFSHIQVSHPKIHFTNELLLRNYNV